MEWYEKIRQGMALIKEGRKENTDWTKCQDCPFTDFCDLIMEDSDKVPQETFFPWEEES